jgi:hypothetical protein
MVLTFAIFDQVTPPSVENSQRKTFPVWPVSVNAPLLVVLQYAAEPVMVPPTVAAETVMDNVAVLVQPLLSTVLQVAVYIPGLL